MRSNRTRSLARLLLPLTLIAFGGLPLIPAAAGAPAPMDVADERESGIARLGEILFSDPRLSTEGTVSCATCHDPDRSFADGRRHSLGQHGKPVGRNAPTLFGLVDHDAFLDPAGGTPTTPRVGWLGEFRIRTTAPEALSLAERCLAPLGNAIEMGASIDLAVKTYRERIAMDSLFDDVFGSPGGVTVERVGNALASFVLTLDAPEGAPYLDFIEGDRDALDPSQTRGEGLFSGKGSCVECHGGPSLRDGALRVASRLDDRLARAKTLMSIQVRESQDEAPKADQPRKTQRPNLRGTGRRQLSAEARRALRESMRSAGIRGGGYGGGIPALAATPTLWDVARTAPYFGDGSAKDLRTAVKAHILELRGVRESLDEAKTTSEEMILAAYSEVSESLFPVERSFAEWPTPDALNASEIEDLVAFLGSLSPPSR